MSIPSRLSVILGLLALGSSVMAQSATTEPGLIGKRHAGADFSYDHFNGSAADKALGGFGVVNLPLTSQLDLGFSYRYMDASGDNYDAVDREALASLLVHTGTEYGRAYFAGSLGYGWHRVNSVRENDPRWGVRAGYEIPLGRQTAANLGLAYSDAFDSDTSGHQVLRYFAEVNHWFSRDLAGVVSASYRQVKQSPDSVSFTAGLRWAF